jgi:hypothetical protein
VALAGSRIVRHQGPKVCFFGAGVYGIMGLDGWMKCTIEFSLNQSMRFGMNGWSCKASLAQVVDLVHGILIGWEFLTFSFFGSLGMGTELENRRCGV